MCDEVGQPGASALPEALFGEGAAGFGHLAAAKHPTPGTFCIELDWANSGGASSLPHLAPPVWGSQLDSN